MQGVMELKGGEGLLLGLDHRREKRLEIDDDRWVPPVGEEERGGCTDLGLRENGLWADFFSGPNRSPEVQNPIFILLLLFSFL
jgi:hypothetical protein